MKQKSNASVVSTTSEVFSSNLHLEKCLMCEIDLELARIYHRPIRLSSDGHIELLSYASTLNERNTKSYHLLRLQYTLREREGLDTAYKQQQQRKIQRLMNNEFRSSSNDAKH